MQISSSVHASSNHPQPGPIDLESLFSAPHAGAAATAQVAPAGFARNLLSELGQADSHAAGAPAAPDLGVMRSRLVADRLRRSAPSGTSPAETGSGRMGAHWTPSCADLAPRSMPSARPLAAGSLPGCADVCPPPTRAEALLARR